MCNEIPAHMCSHTLSPEGNKEDDRSTAKVMACQLCFSTVIRRLRSSDDDAAHSDLAPSQADSEFHIIHGKLGSRLSDLISLRAALVHESIRTRMWMCDQAQQALEILDP